MSTINKVFESLKVLTGPVFVIFSIWQISTGNVTPELVDQILAILAALLGGSISGSGISRLRRSFKE